MHCKMRGCVPLSHACMPLVMRVCSVSELFMPLAAQGQTEALEALITGFGALQAATVAAIVLQEHFAAFETGWAAIAEEVGRCGGEELRQSLSDAFETCFAPCLALVHATSWATAAGYQLQLNMVADIEAALAYERAHGGDGHPLVAASASSAYGGTACAAAAASTMASMEASIPDGGAEGRSINELGSTKHVLELSNSGRCRNRSPTSETWPGGNTEVTDARVSDGKAPGEERRPRVSSEDVAASGGVSLYDGASEAAQRQERVANGAACDEAPSTVGTQAAVATGVMQDSPEGQYMCEAGSMGSVLAGEHESGQMAAHTGASCKAPCEARKRPLLQSHLMHAPKKAARLQCA
jgi:hypothetical protein